MKKKVSSETEVSSENGAATSDKRPAPRTIKSVVTSARADLAKLRANAESAARDWLVRNEQWQRLSAWAGKHARMNHHESAATTKDAGQ